MAISASLPPTPACSLYPRQNKQDSHSGFEENADCKGKPCLNSQEQKTPGFDIHLHILTLPHET